MEVKIDEEVLRQIAADTGGKYFRATNTKQLNEIYTDIDKLEKSKIDVTEFRHKSEEFYPLIMFALLLFGLDVLLRFTLLRSLP